jgi:hypothetical protein
MAIFLRAVSRVWSELALMKNCLVNLHQALSSDELYIMSQCLPRRLMSADHVKEFQSYLCFSRATQAMEDIYVSFPDIL